MKKVLIFLLISFLISFTNIYASNNIRHKISLTQARSLVWVTLSPDALRLKDIQIINSDRNPENIDSYECPANKRFLSFSVLWNGLPNGICYFAVDSYTGDVFHTNVDCGTYSIKKLEALQKKVRRSIHLTDKQYRKIKINDPEEALAC